MKYHALFAIFEKSSKTLNCRLLQIIGGALRVKLFAHWVILHALLPSVDFFKIIFFEKLFHEYH